MAKQPLFGCQILMTRTQAQNEGLAQAIRARGGVPIDFPCLQLEVMPEAIETGLAMLPDYSDIIFTSANGVQSVVDFLLAQGDSLATRMKDKRIAAVGAKTQAALVDAGVHVDLVPDLASQDGLIDLYRRVGMPQHGLLFFRAEEGRDSLIKAMTRQGIKVAMVPAYRTVCPDQDATAVCEMLARNEIAAVLLGSPKAARHYLRRIGDPDLANRAVLVAISEKMAAAAGEIGLKVQLVAESASFDSMLDVLEHHYDSGAK